MNDQEFGSMLPRANEPTPEPAWETIPQTPPAGYTQTSAQPPYAAQATPAQGLSDNTAGALAYVTIIPAIIFLVLEPYNKKPFVKFHAIQELGLFVFMICLHIILIIPILGWLIYILGAICALVAWIICIVKASQGGALKLPVIGKFAAEQSGYVL
jgi:uncharacterized membrane protein